MLATKLAAQSARISLARLLPDVALFSSKTPSFQANTLHGKPLTVSQPKLGSQCRNTSWIKESRWLGAPSPRTPAAADKAQLITRINRLSNAILAANWGDVMTGMLHVSFWEDEYDRLNSMMHWVGRLNDPELSAQWSKMASLMDYYFIAEDLRDHINEILEYLERIAPTEHPQTEVFENIGEHITAILEQYEMLDQAMPELRAKLEESVGRGVSLLRQRVRFDWPKKHEAYY